MGWRVAAQPLKWQQNPITGKWEALLTVSAVVEWEGPGESPERKPDSVTLHVREPAPIPYLDN